MIDQEIKKTVKEAFEESLSEKFNQFEQRLNEIEELLSTERISVSEAKKILGYKDQRTVKSHLSKAGIEPVFDENGNPKFIKKEIIDYARNKDLKITV